MRDSATQLGLQAFFEKLSKARKSALLLDYDGTLSPFHIHRYEAYPFPGVSLLLTRIIGIGHTRVVVVTGRRAHEVLPLLGVDPHPEIWGVHGLQRLRPDGSCEMPHLNAAAAQALLEADSWLEIMGLHHLAEHKPGSLAVHWRGMPNDEQSKVRRIIMLRWLPLSGRAGTLLQEFDGGIEMRSSLVNKGDAVRAVLGEIDRDAPVAYLGDDVMDEDAFRALSNRGLRVLVRPKWRKTAADVWLRPPAELLEFLSSWLEACRDAQPTHLGTG